MSEQHQSSFWAATQNKAVDWTKLASWYLIYNPSIIVSVLYLELVILTVALVLDVEVCYAVFATSVSRTRPRTVDPTAPSWRGVRHPVESRAVSSAETGRLTVAQSIRRPDPHSSNYQCVRNGVPRSSAWSHRICKTCRHMCMYNSFLRIIDVDVEEIYQRRHVASLPACSILPKYHNFETILIN